MDCFNCTFLVVKDGCQVVHLRALIHKDVCIQFVHVILMSLSEHQQFIICQDEFSSLTNSKALIQNHNY